MKIIPIAGEATRFHVESDNYLLCSPCNKLFKRNSSGHCPKCHQPAEPANYIVDVASFLGRGQCSCRDFECRVQPLWEKHDFSARPCRHLIGDGEEGVFSVFGRIVARGIGERAQTV